MTQQPDLQAILATLAQYSQQQPSSATPPPAPQPIATSNNNTIAAQIDKNAQATSRNGSIETAPADPRLRGRPQSRSTTPFQAQYVQPQPVQPQPPSVIDPATITVWQDGLRCVTKIASQNKTFENSIRKMMQDQRSHEMRWYAERQALKQTQANRASSAAKVTFILQSLNQATTVPSAHPQSDEAKEAELATFDCKVYAAQQSMETAMTAELKSLGVPFFGTDVDLIVAKGQQASDAASSVSRQKWSVPITETELLDLKRKMVAHLEMLYRD